MFTFGIKVMHGHRRYDLRLYSSKSNIMVGHFHADVLSRYARTKCLMLRLSVVFILTGVPAVAGTVDSLFFRVPTTNVILPAFEVSRLADGSQSDVPTAWTLAGSGELVFERDSSCHFAGDTQIVSPEVDGSLYSRLELRIDMATKSEQSEWHTSNIYPVSLVYSDGERVECEFPMGEPGKKFAVRTMILDDLRALPFKIEISGGDMVGSNYNTLLREITLVGTYVAPQPSPVPSPTSLSLPFPAGYDSCLVDIRRSVRNASSTDTICYSSFDDGGDGGFSTDALSLGAGDYFHGFGRGNVSLWIPVVAMGVTDSLYVSFSTRKWVDSEVNTYTVTYNDSVIGRISHPRELSSSVWERHAFAFVPTSSLGVIEINNTDSTGGNKELRLLVDDLLVYQKSMYTYRSIEGYPRAVCSDETVDGLYCNEEYRVMRQYIGVGIDDETVVTTMSDERVMTTGERLSLVQGGTMELDGDFGGSVFMDSTSCITGRGRVMGELCYVMDYRPGEWESVGLPFAPHLVGAFIGGVPYYLRENIDYHLQSYTCDDGGQYSFAPSPRIEGYRGYLVKVPEGISYDDNTLYIYSSKGVEINAPHSFVLDGLYTHLANPYLRAVTDVWQIFGAEVVYRYDGHVFRPFTTSDELPPFESVIVYGGSPNAAPRMISLGGSSGVAGDVSDEVMIATHDGAIALHGYSGQVTIRALSGVTVFAGHVVSGSLIPLGQGIYIITCGSRTVKVAVM